ncbi:hypothetical protein QUF49_04765 [Fictibacillus sp. b24]|uniref:hypothetical protein n=1 Tax=Fictibacillus sp. b24 TaxID=3055863 RepID=UPI0025A02948|nr:hypothetical protein [Fictibacillus sp. b24]MDM5315296.1 hypothetical protein [Fictibacillus sp. b24]
MRDSCGTGGQVRHLYVKRTNVAHRLPRGKRVTGTEINHFQNQKNTTKTPQMMSTTKHKNKYNETRAVVKAVFFQHTNIFNFSKSTIFAKRMIYLKRLHHTKNLTNLFNF